MRSDSRADDDRGSYTSRGQNGDVATVARPWVSQGKTPTLWREWLPQKCLILGRVRYKAVAACDPYGLHLERGWRYAGPLSRTFDDHHKLLDEVKPQAVVVAVPLAPHFDICRDALDAGSAVFCEKTTCYFSRSGSEVGGSRRGKTGGISSRSATTGQRNLSTAAAMVQTGMLGRITAVQCEWCRNNNWRRPMPVPRGHADFGKLNHQLNWRLFRDTSQGLMAELGAHQLDVANWFLGTPPKRVFATGGIDYWCDGREVFDNNRQRIGRHARRTCVVRRTCPAHGSCDDLIGMRRPRQRDDDPHGQ